MPAIWTSVLNVVVGRSTKKSEIDAAFNNTLYLFENMLPPGVYVPYGGAAAPVGNGWLLCDGAAVSRTTYAALFAAISTAYGVGDGSTTFNLPDMRGKFPLGKAAAGTGSALGGSGGTIDHVHTYTQVPNHTHPITDPGHFHAYDKAAWTTAGTAGASEAGNFSSPSNNTGSKVTGITGTNNPSGGVATGTTNGSNPPFLAGNFIIRTGL